MGLLVPHAAQSFEWWTSNSTGRPSAAMGTSMAPGNNSFPTYTQLLSGASVAQDVYGVLININSNAVAAAARNTLVNIGVDPAGGTSYTTTISNLLGSCAGPNTFGGIWYYFPLWIRAGSSIAAQASVNNATVGTLSVYMQLFGQPTNPESIKVGTYVDTFGATTGTSSGTAVTSGTTSEGTWTSLGTTTRSLWWWQAGMGVNDTTMAALVYGVDLGVGTSTSNARAVVQDLLAFSDSSERLNYGPSTTRNEFDTPSGQTVYGRLQCSGTADASLSMCGYGLGG